MKKIVWTQIIAITFTVSIVAGLVGGALTNEYLISYLFGQLTEKQEEEFPIVKKVIEEKIYVEESSTISAIEKAKNSIVHFWDIFETGTIITTDGIIATCNKPFTRANQFAVYLDDETEYLADVIFRDPKKDIALMKIQTENDYEFFETLEYGDENIKLGQKILSLGRDNVKSGIIAQMIDVQNVPFKVDYEINNTFECGPTINLNGEFVGMTKEDIDPEQGTSDVIPAHYFQQALQDLQ